MALTEISEAEANQCAKARQSAKLTGGIAHDLISRCWETLSCCSESGIDLIGARKSARPQCAGDTDLFARRQLQPQSTNVKPFWGLDPLIRRTGEDIL
jgi:hypothetical protein